MIAAWAIYATLFALLLGLAARAAEETLDAWGFPTRWAWAAAAAGSVAVPAALRWDLFGRALRRAGELAASGGAEAAPVAAATASTALTGRTAGGAAAAWPDLLHFPAAADRAVLAAWALGSALVLLGALRAWWRMRQGSRSWPSLRIAGTEVRVSEDVGPAVWGVLDPVVVLPRRILALPEEDRRLVVRHEREHRRARDPALLAVGLAALAACPWNPALWWVARRLRLAVERDCDRRVLASGADPAAYGSVLLAEAGGRPSPLPAAALGQGRSHLERRIRALSAGPSRFRTLRSAAAAAVAGALVFAACDAPTPPDAATDGTGDLVADASSTASSLDGAPDDVRPRFVPRDVEPRAVNDREIRDLLVNRYPAMLRDAGVGGSVVVWLFVDRNGAVEEARVQESSGYRAMDRAALEVAREMEFEPARSGGRPVAVWVSRRLTFRTDPGVTTGDGSAVEPKSGDQGPGDVIRIRGNTTLEVSYHPLIFLDGERLEDRSGLSDLDPEDIDSIEVIKGPAAEALYGPEAADGVIRIETKSGG